MAADARHSRRAPRRAPRRGLTLLELILALALSTFVVYAIGLAIHLHLRSLDATRTEVEEAQLARAVLQLMSDDLRGALQQRKQDFSGVEAVLANSLQAAAAQAMAAAAEAGDGGGEGDGDGGEGDEGDQGGGQGGGGQGGGQGGGGQSGGGSGGEDLTGDDMGLGEEPLAPDYTLDIAGGEMIPPVVGIYGNAFELQIDVSRVPRIDEYRTLAAGAAGGMPPSDIKTIAYYVRSGTGGVLMQGVNDPFGATSGLVRRETSRSQAAYSYSMGGGTVDASREVIVAPEVTAVQFLYFDGFQWQTEWDSTVMGGLPFAVSIEIAVTTNDDTPEEDLQAGLSQPQVIPYRLVVPIPTAEPIPPEAVDENLEELGLMP